MGRRVYADLDAFFRANPDESMMKVANDVGVSLSMMSYLRNGLRQPGLDTALRIRDRCHIPIETLVVEPERRTA